MRKLNGIPSITRFFCLALAIPLLGGCSSRVRVENAYFPPGSDYASSRYNVNVVMRDIGLDRVEIVVSIYEQRRKPCFKREYTYTVHSRETLHCTVHWETLDDLQILFTVMKSTPSGNNTLPPLTERVHTWDLHFMFDEAMGTFNEVPNSNAPSPQ